MSCLVLAGCTTMSVRTGLVVIGGRPAFQASIESGTSMSGRRQGMSATYEIGAESAADTRVFAALNVDHYLKDPDAGPVARIGGRFRARGNGDDGTDNAFELHGTAFTGLGRDRKTGSGGFGVELAGGLAVDQHAPIFEANLVLHRRWNLLD